MPLCSIKWRPLKFFQKLHKNPLLIAKTVKVAVSGLRQFLATETTWKIIKNIFYFILTNWIWYWQIKFCSYYAFWLNQMCDIREAWKYWPLKVGFRSISQKFYKAAILWRVDQKFKLLADIFLRAAFKILHCRVYSYFHVLLIKLIWTIFNEMK